MLNGHIGSVVEKPNEALHHGLAENSSLDAMITVDLHVHKTLRAERPTCYEMEQFLRAVVLSA